VIPPAMDNESTAGCNKMKEMRGQITTLPLSLMPYYILVLGQNYNSSPPTYVLLEYVFCDTIMILPLYIRNINFIF
jgi:hypothetical protein